MRSSIVITSVVTALGALGYVIHRAVAYVAAAPPPLPKITFSTYVAKVIEESDYPMVQSLLQHYWNRVDEDYTDNDGRPLMQYAAATGDIHMVRDLLGANAKCHRRYKGYSAYDYATEEMRALMGDCSDEVDVLNN